MDITQWYGVALGTLAALVLAVLHVRASLPVFLLKHIFYPQINPHIGGGIGTTLPGAVAIGVFLIGNATCMALGVKSSTHLLQRTAHLSVINTIPLFLGGRINPITNVLGIRYETYAKAHRWTGRVAVIQALVHASVAAASQKGFRGQSQIAGLIAASAMAAIYLLSTGPIRRHFYEAFAKLHMILAPLALCTVWLHLPHAKPLHPPRVYLLAAFCLHGATYMSWLIYTTYRNLGRNARFNVASITKTQVSSTDIMVLRLKLARPWRFRPGQYLYLRLLTLKNLAFLQSHPFYVCSWDGDTISLLVEKRNGLTAALVTGTTAKAIVEGPFGTSLGLQSYGTVVLFATGIGIAAQLPYIRRLLEGHQNREVTAQRIILLWEIESEGHKHWVTGIMHDLLSMDVQFILRVHVFIQGDFVSSNRSMGGVYAPPKANTSRPNRLHYHYPPLDIEARIRNEVESAKGKTLVALCANSRRSASARASVCQAMGQRTTLEVIDVLPGRQQGIWAYVSAMRSVFSGTRYAAATNTTNA